MHQIEGEVKRLVARRCARTTSWLHMATREPLAAIGGTMSAMNQLPRTPRRYGSFDFPSLDAGIAACDAWVVGHGPSSTSNDLREYERRHEAGFYNDYGRLKAQFDVAFDHLVALVDQVNFTPRQNWPPHRAIQFIMLSHNLKTFVSSMDRLTKGYYEDSVTLSRVLYETYHRLLFVSCFPDQPWGAVTSAPGIRQFNLTNFVRDDLRLDWRKLYKSMSRFAHSNAPSVLQSLARIEDGDGQPERFGLMLDDQSATKEFAATFLPFLALAFLRFAVERFVDETSDPRPAELEAAVEAIDWMSYIVRSSAKPLWQTVSKDLDYISDLLELADAGGDWRALARARPEVAPD